MRILLLYERHHIGGGQTYIDECVAQLRRLGATVDLIEGDQINWLVVKSIFKGKYECAFLHFLSPQYLTIVVYLLLARVPIVTVLHGIWVREFRSQRPSIGTVTLLRYWFFQYALCVCSKQIIVLSDYAASLVYKTFPFMRHKIRIIPGGVNLKMFHPVNQVTKIYLRKTLNLPASGTIVLIVSRLERRKGIADAILAFSYYVKKHPDSMLCLVIPFGPYNQYELLPDIMNVIEERKLNDHVRFIPSGSRKENAKYYQLSDILLVSSKELEMFGLVILEALACGCLPITYPNNGLADVLMKIFPSLVAKKGLPISLYQSLLNILSLPTPMRRGIVNKGRNIVRQYSWIQIGGRVYSMLQNLK